MMKMNSIAVGRKKQASNAARADELKTGETFIETIEHSLQAASDMEEWQKLMCFLHVKISLSC